MTLSGIASGRIGGADDGVVAGVTADPVSVVAVARGVSAARPTAAARAPVEDAVSAVHVAVIRTLPSLGDILVQSYGLLHPLEEGIDLAVAATLGGARKCSDQAQGEN